LLRVSEVPIPITKVVDAIQDFPSCSFDDDVNTREGEDVFNRDCVDLSIVKDWPVTPILLSDIEDWRGIWRVRFTDKAGFKLFIDIFGLELLFSSGQRVCSAGD
jgi:hypothetical protein